MKKIPKTKYNIKSSIHFSSIIEIITTIKDRGFFHIVTAEIINNFINFFTIFALVRILSKQTYGEWTYAVNILNICLLFGGIGVVPALLQYCSSAQNISQTHSYFKFGIKVGFISNIILSGIILFIACFIPLPIEGSNKILLYLSFIPLITILFQSILIYLRSTFQNKPFSFLNVMNTIIYFIGSVGGGLLFGVVGVVLGRYFSYIISIGGSIKFLKSDLRNILNAKKLDYFEKKAFLGFAITAMFTESIASLLYLIDVQLIGSLTQNAIIVASYQTATIIPFALNFLPMAIMTFLYPYFAKNSYDINWILNKYKLLLKYLIPINAGISAALFISAPIIIPAIFGPQYVDSILPFRILIIGYFFAGTFRIPAGNILASIKLIRINLFNAIISGTLNVVLNLALIPIYGSIGAALTTVSIFIISSMISNCYLLRLSNNPH